MIDVTNYLVAGEPDDSKAFDLALVAAVALGQEVYVPARTYRFMHTVVMPDAVALGIRGEAVPSPWANGSIIALDPGVSGFRASISGDRFAGLFFTCPTRLTSTSVVSAYEIGSSITVSSGHDFHVGQVVRLPGAGEAKTLTTLKATCSGTSIVITYPTALVDPPFGIKAGMFVIVPGAFNSPAKVTAISGSTLTVDRSASAAVSNASIKLVLPMHARIVSISGTTITVDNYNADGHAVTSTALEHADCGVDATEKVDVIGCSFGGLQGAGVLLLGSHGFTPASNCNLSLIFGGYANACEHAAIAHGTDSNQCTVLAFHGVANRSYSFMDTSFLGNHYSGCHSDGGFGFITQDSFQNRSSFEGCYCEGGTAMWIGSVCQIRGGVTPTECGGTRLAEYGQINQLTVGDASNGVHSHETRSNPFQHFLEMVAKGATYGLMWRMADAGEGINSTGWMLAKWASTLRSALGIAFDSNEQGWPAGTMWFPNGFKVGTSANGADAPMQSVDIRAGVDVPLYSAPDGSLYLRKDGGTLYVRQAGSWVAK